MSLNKFTHIPLLRIMPNFFFLKKVINNHAKKSNHPKFFIKIKNMFQKKSYPVKIKINYHTQALKNQNKKIRKKKKRTTLLPTLLPRKERRKKKKCNLN